MTGNESLIPEIVWAVRLVVFKDIKLHLFIFSQLFARKSAIAFAYPGDVQLIQRGMKKPIIIYHSHDSWQGIIPQNIQMLPEFRCFRWVLVGPVMTWNLPSVSVAFWLGPLKVTKSFGQS